ncbi:hypothetical protein A2771_01465 [Candidatus Woesebacteria bacterium RIFCSPHIGHO2_01_FULL_38_26b]|uniref:Peptidase S8/S53 domain-containing protein n=1 Tax=Candidatus Woesebacteria bacterium RIFCSPHIGHO2_01_FULL_38_26b TaxID=1802491 RepID=A0A1F7Y078_9BACT|nr:MAG: hypothetical protein A2771_01465 [Candidatus Woesebacteria bacterium RIFCSPHIGHO2_01_FULL_38_26b]
MKRLLVFFIISFLIIFYFANTKEVVGQHEGDTSERVIVKFKPLVPHFLKQKVLASYGLNLDEELRLKDSFVVKASKGRGKEFTERLNRNLFVEYAEEDYAAEKLDVPNDPELSKQWGLSKINADSGWDISHGNSNVKIAVVDTGINYNHPDISSKIELSVNCTSSSCSRYFTSDPDGHGTHVAGISAGITNNGVGIAGIGWDSKLFSVKVLDDSGSGYYSWIANGIMWAADNGADVINLSLGGSLSSFTLENAVNYAWNKGVVIVAAAGNRGSTSRTYPAYYSNAIAVAATDSTDKKASFSNYGSWVEVASPGVSIYSTYGSGYEYLSGTSMATPFVSGLAALIKAKNPAFSNSQIRGKLESSSDAISGTGFYWTYGRINACKALDCILGVTPTLSPTSSPTPRISPMPSSVMTLTPTPLPTLSFTPTPTSVPLLSPTPSPIPTPSIPWWCKYFPSHNLCRV